MTNINNAVIAYVYLKNMNFSILSFFFFFQFPPKSKMVMQTENLLSVKQPIVSKIDGVEVGK